MLLNVWKKDISYCKPKEIDDEEFLKQIYTWSREKTDELLRRKQHIEIKILYLLPVITVIMGFVTYNLKELEKLGNNLKLLVNIANVGSYVLLIISLLILITGLQDNLLSKKWVRALYNYQYGTNIQLMNGIIDSTYPKKMLTAYNGQKKEGVTNNVIYKTMIENEDRVCDNIMKVSIAKNMCFTFGVKFNLYATITILFKSFIVINWG